MNTIKVLDLSNNFCGALIWGVFDDLNKKKDNMYKLVSPHGISSASYSYHKQYTYHYCD